MSMSTGVAPTISIAATVATRRVRHSRDRIAEADSKSAKRQHNSIGAAAASRQRKPRPTSLRTRVQTPRPFRPGI